MTAEKYLKHLLICFVIGSDQRACPRVSGVHGPAGVREETRSDHYAQETRHPGSSQETHQGKSQLLHMKFNKKAVGLG